MLYADALTVTGLIVSSATLKDRSIVEMKTGEGKTLASTLASYLNALARESVHGMISINKGLIQTIPTSLPPQPIGEATKVSNLRRIPPGVQGRSHFTYFLYLIVQNMNTIFLYYRVTLRFGSMGGLDLACPINRLPLSMMGIQCGNIMDEVNIEDLTIEQYFIMTQESQIPKKVDDITIAEYLEYKEAMKTQDYGEYQPHSAKANVLTTYRDHLSLRHKSLDPLLDTKTNPYLHASQSPVHSKITKTTSKYTREVEEQSNRARDDALRKWEAQIDQLRREEHEVIDIFSINAIADLGASVNIMSKSMLDELSLVDPKHANIIVEMADKTREVSLRIKEDRVKIKMKEQECKTVIGEHLNKRPTSQAELSHGAVKKTHWCESVHQEHEKGYTLWASCDPHHKICDVGGIPDKKLKQYWKSTNDNDRINLEWEGLSCTNWFLEVSKDKDDLEGIIDYLEPILYDGFIDYNDKAYKQKRNKLLGIPYTEPPPIKKEEAEITKYNLGAGEVFTKTTILNIKEFPRTAANIADIKAKIFEERMNSSEDLLNTKRRHWCKPFYQWKDDICTKCASCNPHFDECDGGDNPRENKEYWESSNDDIQTTLE
ncbi:hypothetical protein Tco_1021500 [Tanacetum coccineum]